MSAAATHTATGKAHSTVAVIGGGLMGVALAIELAQRGRTVTLYEASDRLGGLSTWEDFGLLTWDRFYHCILPTDRDLLDFLRGLGLDSDLRWAKTSTGVFIDGSAYPLDSAMDFARFSALSLLERARLALTLVRCALVRDVRALEGTTAEEWFVRVGGARAYRRLWLPLLRAKFGESADRVSPVFLVAKVKRMLTARADVGATESLGYVTGGYRQVWQAAASRLSDLGVTVLLGQPVSSLEPAPSGRGACVITAQGRAEFERVITTLPFEASRELARGWPSPMPIPSVARVEYMGLVCLVLALKRRVLPNYVMNIADEGFPFTGVISMTNLVDKAEVGGFELAYVPSYVTAGDPLLAASDDTVFDRAFAGLTRLYPDLARRDVAGWWVRRAEVVQPVQGIGYSHDAPQPDFRRGPLTVVNNSQLLETDLNNSRVVAHARAAVDALDAASTTGSSAAGRSAEPAVVRFVLPAHNEERAIAALCTRIAETMRGEGRAFAIYVVDDGSSDATPRVAETLAPRLPVRVIRHDVNRGLGGALDTGLRAALADAAEDDAIVTMDADLTHDPRFTPRLLDRYRDGYDVVIASRFRPGSLEIGVSTARRLLTRAARLFYGSLVPVEGVRDYSCGYRLYRAGVLAAAYEMLGDRFITERGFACMVEVLGKLRRLATFAEVPFVLHYEDKLTASQMRVVPTIAQYVRVVAHVWRLDATGQLGARPARSRLAYALLFGVIVASVAGQVLLKAGVSGAEISGLAGLASALSSPMVWGGILAYGASAALWIAVLTKLDLSVAYPMGALSYVLVLVASGLLGEHIPAGRWIGVVAIVTGIALIGFGFEARTRTATHPAEEP